jgi:hypothetical protein
MKRIGLFLLAVVMQTGCGGGGDADGPTGSDGTFNFNGHWAYQGTVASSSDSGMPVGTKIADTATITASGTSFTMDFPGSVPAYIGTCDPAAGTFQAEVVWKGTNAVIEGQSTGSESMKGKETWTTGSSVIVIEWTMSLNTRKAGTPGAISRAELAEAFAKAVDTVH